MGTATIQRRRGATLSELLSVITVISILLGLGFRRFSVEPVLLPGLAALVARTSVENARGRALSACAAPDSDSVRRLIGAPAAGAGRPAWQIAGH